MMMIANMNAIEVSYQIEGGKSNLPPYVY